MEKKYFELTSDNGLVELTIDEYLKRNDELKNEKGCGLSVIINKRDTCLIDISKTVFYNFNSVRRLEDLLK